MIATPTSAMRPAIMVRGLGRRPDDPGERGGHERHRRIDDERLGDGREAQRADAGDHAHGGQGGYREDRRAKFPQPEESGLALEQEIDEHTAEPENRPRRNSIVPRSAAIRRTKMPAVDQNRAASATRARPRRCCEAHCSVERFATHAGCLALKRLRVLAPRMSKVPMIE